MIIIFIITNFLTLKVKKKLTIYVLFAQNLALMLKWIWAFFKLKS